MIKNASKSLHPVIASYMPLVDFLGKLIGPHCEVVLHDLTSPERSVVNITNGDISGRSVGAPLTDFALRMIRNNAYATADYLHEYAGALKTGKRVRSSTFFIKDGEGELIGLLCFNRDLSRLQSLHDELDGILAAYFNSGDRQPPLPASPHISVAGSVPGNGANESEASETFSESVEELMSTSVAKALAPYNLPPERLSPGEREDAIEVLHRKGFFQLRGAVEYVAAVFRLSEATIYRHLKNVQKRNS